VISGVLRSRAGIAVVLLTAIAAALRFATIDQQSYFYDEAVTAAMTDGSLADVFRGIVDTESTPPLYYLAAWVWAHLVGSDEAQLRSLSAIAGTLVVPVAFAAGRAVGTVRIGLAAAALAAVSPMLVWYAQEARAYSLLALLGGASFVLFVLARDVPSRQRLVWWAVVSALAVATHYFAAFVVGAEALLLLRAHPRLRAVRWAIGSVAAVGVCLLPLAAVQASHRRLGWVGGIDLEDRVTEALQRFVTAGQPSSWWGATGAEITPYAWIGAAVVLGIAVALLARRATAHERSGALLALTVAAVGIGAPIAMAIVADVATGGDGDYFLDRNVLGAWVPLAVFVSAGLAARRAGLLGAVCLAAVLCWSVVVYVDIVTSPDLQRDDWRSVGAALPEDERSVVVVYPEYQKDALRLQRPDLVEQAGPRSADAVVLVLAGFTERPETFRVPAGFVEAGSDELQHFLLIRYERDGTATVRPADLARGPVEDSDLGILVVEPG
jgi:mannosyltransferase